MIRVSRPLHSPYNITISKSPQQIEFQHCENELGEKITILSFLYVLFHSWNSIFLIFLLYRCRCGHYSQNHAFLSNSGQARITLFNVHLFHSNYSTQRSFIGTVVECSNQSSRRNARSTVSTSEDIHTKETHGAYTSHLQLSSSLLSV